MSANRAPLLYPNRHKFKPDEDARLLELVKNHGAKKWDFIAQHLTNRTGRQCRDRYCNYLMKDLRNGPWTIEEDFQLIRKVEEFGSHWAKIATFFEGRSPNNLKNRWYTYGRKLPKKKIPKDTHTEAKRIDKTKKITSIQSILSEQTKNNGETKKPKTIITKKIICGSPTNGQVRTKSISPDLKNITLANSQVCVDNTFFEDLSLLTPKIGLATINLNHEF